MVRFQLNINLTEEIYLSFNIFHALESCNGKKMVARSRLIFSVAMLFLILMMFLSIGISPISVGTALFLAIFLIVYMLTFKKVLVRSITKQIKNLQKTGKLPYDAQSSLAFYDDRIVEISPSKRMEQNYDTLERICVVTDRFILLYHSSVGAYILPMTQLNTQLDSKELLDFLAQKCSVIEYY